MGMLDKLQHAYAEFSYNKAASNTNYSVDMWQSLNFFFIVNRSIQENVSDRCIY